MFCAGTRFLPRGRDPEVEGRRRLSSEITARKIVAGDVKRSAEVFLLPLVEMGTAPPIVPGMTC